MFILFPHHNLCSSLSHLLLCHSRLTATLDCVQMSLLFISLTNSPCSTLSTALAHFMLPQKSQLCISLLNSRFRNNLWANWTWPLWGTYTTEISAHNRAFCLLLVSESWLWNIYEGTGHLLLLIIFHVFALLYFSSLATIRSEKVISYLFVHYKWTHRTFLNSFLAIPTLS